MSTFPFRALSPAVTAIVSGASAIEADHGVALRVGAEAATSIEELCTALPQDYRVVLRGPLLDIAKLAKALMAQRSSLRKLEAHNTAGTYPRGFDTKLPAEVTQVTKVYAGTAEAKTHRDGFESKRKEYLTSLLTSAIKEKKDEVQFHEKALTPEKMIEVALPVMEERRKELEKSRKLPTFGADNSITGWEVDPEIKKQFNLLRVNYVFFGLRVVQFEEMRDRALSIKIAKKKEVQAAADDAMDTSADTGVDKTIADAITKAVGTATKKLEAKFAKVGYPNATKSERSSLTPRSYLEDPAERETSEGLGFWQETLDIDYDVDLLCAQAEQAASIAGQGEEEEGAGTGRSWPGSRSRPWSRTRKSVTDPQGYVYRRYDTLPDWILTVPLTQAIAFVHLHTPRDILDAAKFRKYIHLSPGVSVPVEIQRDLSVGMKYMFRQPSRKGLIMSAWLDFERRLRWRIKFDFEQGNSPYDPDFAIIDEPSDDPPKLPIFMEKGIIKGREYCEHVISKVPDDDGPDYYKPLMPSVSRLHKFLLENQYVVTPTDKNLGLAVSERTWLISETQKMLNDERNYRRLQYLEVDAILRKKYQQIRDIADNVEFVVELEQYHVSKWLRHKLPNLENKTFKTAGVIPRFYGIPKIHKNPAGFRPIIPCHSALQNPCSKLISKVLKPIIQSAPAIIHGSKDLAIKFSQLQLAPGRRWYIVTGDVVAFYPNIPLDKCLEITLGFLTEWYCDEQSDHKWDFSNRAKLVFQQCLEVGNTELICTFQNEYYLQLNGLAMGVADSPDLANLYGWYFERENNVLNDPMIAFYGRYIDDCFAIVYADNENQALQKMQDLVKYDGCTIEWSASGQFAHFLDMTVYKDQFNKLQHMPYRKERNNTERIPWISHHPLDVKRGTFIGEMSRLATLSSLSSHYSNAIRGLVALYRSRGYPAELVESWRKKNMTARWEKRLSVDPIVEQDAHGVLVLKSEFNTAWNYFQAKELGDTVFTYWRTWYHHAEAGTLRSTDMPWWNGRVYGLSKLLPEFAIQVKGEDGNYYECPDLRKIGMFDRRWLVSRKRTRNMFDFVTSWKNTVLQHLDAVVVDPEEPEFPAPPEGNVGAHHDPLDERLEHHHANAPSVVSSSSDDEPQNFRPPSPYRNLWL